MVSYGDWELRVHEIKGKMDRGELIPDPDWQRSYIWNQKDEALLIDTIVRQMPMPKFFLTEEYDTRKGASVHYAVDGQQRLTAIYKFLNNKFPVEIGGRDYYFRDLDRQTQQKVTTYRLSGHYLQDFTQADINFLFQRLNRTGVKLTNAEVWHNEFYDTNVLRTLEDIQQEHKHYYPSIVYTDDNIKRMLPLDDITDLCNCLLHESVEGGSKNELAGFLGRWKDMSPTDASKLKSTFRKTVRNLQEVLTKADLESSLYGKRTHFLSLFLGVGLLMREYYLLSDTKKLKSDLLDFIENQPEEYEESVLGAIRQRAKRKSRVELLQRVILKHAKQLDPNRFFPESLKMKLWRRDRICAIDGKPISAYRYAVVDHKEPWAKGGRTDEANAQLAHRRCNQQKRDKAEEFVLV
jgi:5-methylcytosine-specific restriction endonuclease McrA